METAGPKQGYKDLIVWQKSMVFVRSVYEVAGKLPNNEQYGLRSQLTRSAVSIPSNIAEGYGRNGKTELARFLDIAIGSACEAETQLLIINNCFPVITTEQALNELAEILRMLYALIKTLRTT